MATFRKRERITSQKQIDLLFGGSQGKSFVAYPLRAVWMVSQEATTDACHAGTPQAGTEQTDATVRVQVLVSVPKKRLRHAVDRNRAKRQIREAYRHYKEKLAAAVAPGTTISLAFVWQSDQLVSTNRINASMARLLDRIHDTL